MIYKIEFIAKLGAWQLKINKYWFFWDVVKVDSDSGKNTFTTYADVIRYVRLVGLDPVYRNYADVPSVGYPNPPMAHPPMAHPPTWNVTRPVSVSVEQP